MRFAFFQKQHRYFRVPEVDTPDNICGHLVTPYILIIKNFDPPIYFPEIYDPPRIFGTPLPEEVGKARFNVATPTYATVTCRHVQHTYYCTIYKQNPFTIISRGVQGCISMDFWLKLFCP